MYFSFKVAIFALIIFSSVLAKKEEKKNEKQTLQTTTESPKEEKPPTIDWGKCPQLEPKESDRQQKASVLEFCLEQNPVPKNLTETSVEIHQKKIAECALKREKWFTKSGNYKYSKAESEIKNKKLQKAIESQLLKDHKKCESEAKEEFPLKEKLIDQIQLYQACMDFHITETCKISVKQ